MYIQVYHNVYVYHRFSNRAVSCPLVLWLIVLSTDQQGDQDRTKGLRVRIDKQKEAWWFQKPMKSLHRILWLPVFLNQEGKLMSPPAGIFQRADGFGPSQSWLTTTPRRCTNRCFMLCLLEDSQQFLCLLWGSILFGKSARYWYDLICI